MGLARCLHQGHLPSSWSDFTHASTITTVYIPAKLCSMQHLAMQKNLSCSASHFGDESVDVIQNSTCNAPTGKPYRQEAYHTARQATVTVTASCSCAYALIRLAILLCQLKVNSVFGHMMAGAKTAVMVLAHVKASGATLTGASAVTASKQSASCVLSEWLKHPG